MIEVEAAQEILVGLAAARMLGGDEARDDFEQFGDALDRAIFEIDLANDAFRRGSGNTDEIVGPTGNGNQR